MFENDLFHQFIIDHDVIGFFETPIVLKSGRTSSWYVNWRSVTNDTYLLDQLSQFIVSFIETQKIELDTIYGVPEGATKTALVTGLKLAQASTNYGPGSHTLSMGRAKPKEHGDPKDRYFIGAPQGKTLVLEDTTTTGESLFQAIDHLKQQNIDPFAALILTHRSQYVEPGKSIEEKFSEKYHDQIQLFAMSRASELLPLAMEKNKPKKSIWEAIQKEFEETGTEKLKG